MVISHMALLTGPWIQGFFFGKAMPCMTLITGVVLIAVSFVTLFFFLGFCLDAHVVTAPTASAAFH